MEEILFVNCEQELNEKHVLGDVNNLTIFVFKNLSEWSIDVRFQGLHIQGICRITQPTYRVAESKALSQRRKRCCLHSWIQKVYYTIKHSTEARHWSLTQHRAACFSSLLTSSIDRAVQARSEQRQINGPLHTHRNKIFGLHTVDQNHTSKCKSYGKTPLSHGRGCVERNVEHIK